MSAFVFSYNIYTVYWYIMFAVSLSLLPSFACSNACTFTAHLSRVHISILVCIHERSLLTLPMFTGIHCDVTVGNTNAIINSTVLGYLANIDNRFSPLVRLVKLWARAEGINDSSRGTSSSYALTLMVGMWTSLTVSCSHTCC